eukprot:8916222-Pyramimonas_sp.AAC.1
MASKTALEHSKRVPGRPREAPQTASDGLGRATKTAKMALRWPKTAQEASKRAYRKARKGQNH